MALSMDGVSCPRPEAAVPPPQPLAMPTPAFNAPAPPPDPAGRARLRLQVLAARLAMAAGGIWLALYGAREMHGVVAAGGVTLPEWVFLVLFVGAFAWIAQAAATSVLGLLAILWGGRRPAAVEPLALRQRTALVIPIYNEASERVFARLLAMAEDLDAAGFDHRQFEAFVLSDSTDPAVIVAEELAFARLRALLPRSQKAWYRRRALNTERKAGNVGEFVQCWGGRYDCLLILDADSLMDASTISALAGAMQAEPGLGLLQTSPALIQGRSPFARLQQFASAVYGPVFAAGLAAWHGDDGNYWGHNAIVRTRAFAAHAGLPQMPGRPPHGGHPLSHDFLEAAFLRRAGWGVRLWPWPCGSYEEGPPSLIDALVRDRRWCQGNLQHLRFLGAPGLKLASRVHLLTGIYSYVGALNWLLLVAAGIVLTAQAGFTPYQYFPNEFALFPTWPQFDSERAVRLFLISLGVLLTPKAAGLLAALLRGWFGRGFGGPLMLAMNIILETVLSALFAPLQILAQTRAVLAFLVGRDAGWRPQRREGGRLALAEIWRRHRSDFLLGAAGLVIGFRFAPEFSVWLLPALLGLALGPLLSLASGWEGLGRALRLFGLLATPLERRPPALVRRAEAAVTHWVADPVALTGLARLLADPNACGAHAALAGSAPAELTPALAMAEAKLRRSRSQAHLLQALGPPEEAAILNAPDLLAQALALPERLEFPPPEVRSPRNGAQGLALERCSLGERQCPLSW